MQATKCYEAVLRIAPDRAIAHYNMGSALLEMGNERAARARFVRAIERDPSLLPRHGDVARVYMAKKRWRMAAFHLQLALSLTRRHPALWRELAFVMEQVDDLDKAGYAYSMACALDPFDWATAAAAGRLARKRGRRDEALRLYAQALKVNPECPEARAAVTALASAPFPSSQPKP